jgi:hypothetical protein
MLDADPPLLQRRPVQPLEEIEHRAGRGAHPARLLAAPPQAIQQGVERDAERVAVERTVSQHQVTHHTPPRSLAAACSSSANVAAS